MSLYNLALLYCNMTRLVNFKGEFMTISNISSVLYLQNNLSKGTGLVSSLLDNDSTKTFSGLDLLSSANSSDSLFNSQKDVSTLSQFIELYVPNGGALLSDVSAVNALASLVDEGFSQSSQYVNPYEAASILSNSGSSSESEDVSILSLLS